MFLLLDMEDSLDWTLRHGRSVALSYAIFDAPTQLHTAIGNDVIFRSVLDQACADRVWSFYCVCCFFD